jgi:uncharacterized OB-fold protein
MSSTGTGSDRFVAVADTQGDPRWADPSVVTFVDGRWRLLGSRCRKCDSRFFPKAFSCANCLSSDLESAPLSTDGRVHVSAVANMTQPGFFAPARYGWVDLPSDGVRVFAHVLPVDGEDPDGREVDFVPAVVGGNDDGPVSSIAFRLRGAGPL